MADPDALRTRFTRALEAARTPRGTPDATPETAPDATPYADNLLTRWQEPQRKYHTLDHLTAVLDRVDLLAEYADDPDLVRLAAWFHDAVYLPDRSENEERSARLAERALTEAGLSEEKTAEVARLVRLTTGHDPAGDDRNGQVLCDADLAILASPPSAYAAYSAEIRDEYHFVPNDAFREGRSAVLRQLLDLPKLFHTPYGQEHWEATARYNLGGELEMLST
ncbi:HD domain-containing protein [Streptomyces sp. NPDC003688]